MKISDLHNEITEYREQGGKQLYSTCSWQLDQKIKICKGYPIYIGGHPSHGKTEVTMELLMTWSLAYGWKHYCYFGEGGSIPEIVADLAHKYTGKPMSKKSEYAMTDAEYMAAMSFIGEHFYFADPNKNYTFQQFQAEVAETERHNHIKFDTTVIDPFNDLDYEVAKYGNITYWLKDELKNVRKASADNDRIDIVVVHVADVPPENDKVTGMKYLPKAMPTQWEGGKIWFRRAFTMLNVYRNLEGSTEITVNKVKPKFCKAHSEELEGQDARWTWDWKRNRYFENKSGVRHEILDIKRQTAEMSKKRHIIESDDLPF